MTSGSRDRATGSLLPVLSGNSESEDTVGWPSAANWSRARQLSLFGPDDIAHADGPVATYERPRAGIARAVIAPLPPSLRPARNRAASMPIRCAAVDDTGLLTPTEN